MTALSKATLKATWVANFKPTQTDFANLIDSWTDYYAGLETLGSSINAGSVGVPSFSGASAVSFYDAGQMLTPSYIDSVPAYTSAAISTGTSRAFFRRESQGLIFESFNGSGNVLALNNYTAGTQAISGVAQKNIITFFYTKGTYFQTISPSPGNIAPSAFDTLGQITFQATKTSGGRVTPAAINCYASTNGSAGGVPVILGFSVRASGDASRNQGLQFSIAEGYVTFQPQSAAPSSPLTGSVYYDSVLGKLRCWNGATWNDLF